MLLLMRNKNRKQRGFSLLEALLAIVIIVAAGLGVVELFNSAQNKNKLKATEQVIQQVASATSQLLSTSNDTADTVDQDDVIASGLLPSNVVVGDAIMGPYGAVTVASDETYHNRYTVTTSLPAKQAVALCQDMFRSAAITTGSSGYITTLSGCTDTFSANSNTNQSINLSFPREEYTT